LKECNEHPWETRDDEETDKEHGWETEDDEENDEDDL
jgi:hypothetical protein